MEKKKILIISNAFFPENSPRSIRTTELVKEFSKLGHEVKIITNKKKEGELLAKENGFEIESIGQPFLPAIPLGKNGLLRFISRILNRTLLMLFEYPNIQLTYLSWRRLRNQNSYDLLISIAVPHTIHWGTAIAIYFNRQISKVWVADCGDPYFGLQSDSFKKLFYFRFIEKFFCRNTNYISVPIENAKDCYFAEFHNKIKVIPQGFTFPESINPQINKSTILKFAYTGNLRSYMHYVTPFIEELSKYPTDFRFIFYTEDISYVEGLLMKNAPGKFEFRNYVERFKLYSELQDIDFFVHFPYKMGTQQSLKLIDYHFMGKPILSYDNSQNSKIALQEFFNLNFQKKFVLENPEQFRIENVVEQFLSLLNK